MPHTKNSRFNLAQFMKCRKAAREKAVDENRKLSAEFKKVQRAQEKLATVRDHLKVTGTSTSATNKKPYCTCQWRINSGTKDCKKEEA